MTVIAFDGKSLAADKRATNQGLIRTVTKVRRIRDCLCAGAGEFSLVEEMYAWFAEGANQEDLPAFQSTSADYVGLLVITPVGQILKYERSAYPMDFTESGIFAIGSGRDHAMMAMHLGKSAEEAVLLTAELDSTCGNGVDVLTLGRTRPRLRLV